ncbi:MAG: glycine cleavage system protein T [candidate division Zixibacteria bacterium SM23_73_2]|nr:MAG: glycine cleavage system protein T [candidate division Zixibacteria bacterium SM23_73_2]
MSSPELKKTPFYDFHLKNSAKMVEFAGYWMPIQFQGIIQEHRKVRSKVGLFDITHMGEFEVHGKDALAFLQKVTTNDVSKLKRYQVQYCCMCYPDGGIVDDLLIYKLHNYYMLVVNATNIDKDFQWLNDNLFGDVNLINKSDETALLAIQGPDAEKILTKLTDVDLNKMRYYWSNFGRVSGVDLLFSRTGYTGEDGFELYFSFCHAENLWTSCMEAGKEMEIEPIGLGARDSLRLEMKYALYGNDIDQTTNPIEAGLGWIVKLDKGDFIGRDVILKVKKDGPKRKLVCFVLKDKGFPRKGYDIQKNGEKIGKVTSGIFSPSLEKGIGVGYVSTEFAKLGESVDILIRGKPFSAEIIKPPFYKNFTHK